GSEAKRIVLCRFERTQMEDGSDLVVLDLANDVVFLDCAQCGSSEVGGHHVQTVCPIAINAFRREVEIALQKEAHKCRFLKFTGFGAGALGDDQRSLCGQLPVHRNCCPG